MPTATDIDPLAMAPANSEATPLLADPGAANRSVETEENDSRHQLFNFLEAKTPTGVIYERVIVTLIVVNVAAFILGTLFVDEYNKAEWADPKTGICQKLCDALWFGNYRNNGLDDILHIGATSVLELVTVVVFTIEYGLRFYTADLESSKYRGFLGRLWYIPSFFSLVDLASILVSLQLTGQIK